MDIGGEAQLRRLVKRLDTVELVHVSADWPVEAVTSPDDAVILGREIAVFRPT